MKNQLVFNIANALCACEPRSWEAAEHEARVAIRTSGVVDALSELVDRAVYGAAMNGPGAVTRDGVHKEELAQLLLGDKLSQKMLGFQRGMRSQLVFRASRGAGIDEVAERGRG